MSGTFAIEAARARPKSRADKGYLPTLDGWRAIAVSLVIGAHSVTMIDAAHFPGGKLLSSFLRHAGYGVDIFFALSGFLITTLLLIEKQRAGTIGLAAFYTRRFFRIIPPMAVYLIVVFSIIPIVSGAETLSSLLFIRNYTSGSWYTGHFWSLSIEEHFYAIVPIMILVLGRNALLKASLLLIALCIVVRWYEFTYLASVFDLPQFRTENRIDALMWGSVLAQLLRRPGWRDRMVRLTNPAVIGVVLVGAIVVLIAFEATPIRRTITAFVLPLVIVSTALRPTSWLGQALEWRPVRYIGRLSYSLYLWQMMFLVTGDRPLGLAQDAPWAFAVIGLLAWGSYNLIEKPFIRLGHICSRRLSSATVQSGTVEI